MGQDDRSVDEEILPSQDFFEDINSVHGIEDPENG